MDFDSASARDISDDFIPENGHTAVREAYLDARVSFNRYTAFFAGIAGGILAHHISIFMPQSVAFDRSIELLVIVVLGGMGSITGSILAAIVLTLLPELLREFAGYRMLVYSVVLIAMMIYRPQGLMGTYEFSLQHVLSRLPGMGGKRG